MGKPVIPTKTTPSGICITCRHAESCIYLKNMKRPVLQCEEFEPCESPPAKRAAAHPEPRPAADAELKGLCVNCDNRHHCKYPKPEGGVWHCEEYI